MNVLYVTGGAKCQRVLAYTAFACFIGYWHQDIRADAFKIAQKTTPARAYRIKCCLSVHLNAKESAA